MFAIQEPECSSTICGTHFICHGPLVRPKKETIYPIIKQGKEILHVLAGPKSYEVYAKMGGLLYSLGDEVQCVLTHDSNVMLRNTENENDRTFFTIPEWLFKQDFSPIDAAI